MLKWAVNGPRQTYLPSDDVQHQLPPRNALTQPRRLKRKSSDACVTATCIRPKHSWCDDDKENQLTSTPLPPSSRNFSESPLRKLDSLKDLSNIVPDFTPFKSPKIIVAKSPSPPKTPKLSPRKRLSNKRNTYASTLPTFDVEYSPCALIPGPLLALRGVGIPDSYFEKPRYLTPHPQQLPSTDSPPHECLETKTFIKPKDHALHYPAFMEESSLSSSKMGDTTLERMIDAILESTRKERKTHTKVAREKPPGCRLNMSPTYTPADDPASDLHEVWDSEQARYRQKEQQYRRARLTKKCLFNEREICSPQATQMLELNPGQLRRQGGVRRKRKITKLTASVMSSAQKFLGKAALQTPLLHSHNLRKVFEAELRQDNEEVHPQKLLRNLNPDSGHTLQTPLLHSHHLANAFEAELRQDNEEVHPQKLLRNLSPDSGHNSSSDYEEEGDDNDGDHEDDNAAEDDDLTLAYKSEDNKTLDVTKRRLSLSLTHLSES